MYRNARVRVGPTFQSADEHVSILNELLYELIRPIQLNFVTFQPISEVGTVQKRVAELQSW